MKMYLLYTHRVSLQSQSVFSSLLRKGPCWQESLCQFFFHLVHFCCTRLISQVRLGGLNCTLALKVWVFGYMIRLHMVYCIIQANFKGASMHDRRGLCFHQQQATGVQHHCLLMLTKPPAGEDIQPISSRWHKLFWSRRSNDATLLLCDIQEQQNRSVKLICYLLF